MQSAILRTIFQLAKKTIRTLITREIANLIIQSVIITGIFIGFILGSVKLLLGFTKVVDWVPNIIDSAIDDFIFWIALKIGWVLIPVFIPLVAIFFDEKIVFSVQKLEYSNEKKRQPVSWINDFFKTFRVFIVALFLNLLLIPILFLDTIGPILKLVPSFIIDNMWVDGAVIVTPILYVVLNGFIFGKEFFQIASAPHITGHSKEGYKLNIHLSIFTAGVAVFFLSLIPVLNLIVPIFGIILMVHLYHTLILQKEPTI